MVTRILVFIIYSVWCIMRFFFHANVLTWIWPKQGLHNLRPSKHTLCPVTMCISAWLSVFFRLVYLVVFNLEMLYNIFFKIFGIGSMSCAFFWLIFLRQHSHMRRHKGHYMNPLCIHHQADILYTSPPYMPLLIVCPQISLWLMRSDPWMLLLSGLLALHPRLSTQAPTPLFLYFYLSHSTSSTLV